MQTIDTKVKKDRVEVESWIQAIKKKIKEDLKNAN